MHHEPPAPPLLLFRSNTRHLRLCVNTTRTNIRDHGTKHTYAQSPHHHHHHTTIVFTQKYVDTQLQTDTHPNARNTRRLRLRVTTHKEHSRARHEIYTRATVSPPPPHDNRFHTNTCGHTTAGIRTHATCGAYDSARTRHTHTNTREHGTTHTHTQSFTTTTTRQSFSHKRTRQRKRRHPNPLGRQHITILSDHRPLAAPHKNDM